MPKLTPGNRLYLYQLLRREIGTGRQTLVSRVEEVLAADDLAPEDLGFGSTRELLEGLGDMVKVTVFKKGNTYATLLPNAEWDQLLDRPAGPSAQQRAAAKGKPWKHRTKAKALKPAKPRHVRRPEKPAGPTEADAAQGAPAGAAGPEATPGAAGERAGEAPRAEAALGAQAGASPEGPEAPQAEPAPEAEAEQAARLESPSAGLGDEAKSARAAAGEGQGGPQEAEALPLEETIEAAQPKVPPTPHIKLTVTYDPYAGIARDIAATERNLSEAMLETTRRQGEPAASGQPGTARQDAQAGNRSEEEAPAAAPQAAPQDAHRAERAAGPVASPAPRREATSAEAAPGKGAPGAAEPAAGSVPKAAPATAAAAEAPAPSPAAEAPSPAPEPSGAEPAARREAAPEPRFELLDEAEEAPVAPEPLLVGLPRDFESEVYVPNGPLSLLYQLLPPEEGPEQVLAEDWQVSRSTRSYRGTRNLVSFPLRLAHGDGTPVEVTIRRTTRPASGRHWAVTAVDGRDGTSGATEVAGPDGLPEGGLAVERLLARSVELGPWSEALQALAGVAAPEDWDLPGKGGGRDALRLYLAMTWRAVLEQGLLASTADGAFAAFDTGLLSPLSEHVYACLQGQGEGSPWRLLGFSTTGEGELGDRLSALDPLPHAPRYLHGLGDLVLAPGADVALPRRVERTLGEGARELVAASVRRCAADWRLVAPAVDVESGDRCLLLPVGTASEPAHGTRALCVERAGDGALRATGAHDLARARVEARAVSRSLPAWLERAAPAGGAGAADAS